MGCFSSRTSDHGPIRLQESRKEEEKNKSSNVESVKDIKATENSINQSRPKAVENKSNLTIASSLSNSQIVSANEVNTLVDKWLSDIYSIAKLNYHSKV